MEVRRVFVDKLKMKNGMVLLTGPNCKYILGVLRKAVGERIDVMDGKGYLYRCTINGTKSNELFSAGYGRGLSPRGKTDQGHPDRESDQRAENGLACGEGDRVGRRPDYCPPYSRGRWSSFRTRDRRMRAVETDHDRGFAAVGPLLYSELAPPTPLRGVLPYVDHFENRWLLYEKRRPRP